MPSDDPEAGRRDPTLRERLQALVDLGYGELNLLLANGVGRRGSLLRVIELRQLQRLDLPRLFRVDLRCVSGALLTLRFQLLHALLDTRICVDESFSCVTHKWFLVLPLRLIGEVNLHSARRSRSAARLDRTAAANGG